MRRLSLIMLMLLMLFSLFPGIGQAEESAAVPKLFLNGQLLDSVVKPQMVDGKYTLVPIRVVSENMGYKVEWNQAAKLVTIHNGSDEIILQIDDSSALVNQMPVQMDVPAVMQNGTTLIPLRFVGEQLGLAVKWDQNTKSVFLTKEETEPVESPAMEPEEKSESDESSEELTAGGIVTSIEADNNGEIVLGYRGAITPDKPFKLDNPGRIVIDLPNASFDDSEAFTVANKTLSLSDNPYAESVRYSLFSNDPATVRLVIDLTADADAAVEAEDGEIHIRLAEPGTIPEETTEEPVANTPEEEQVVPDKPYTVVIDAGHGGTDPGAKGINGKWESGLNLSLSLKVKELLDQEPYITPLLSRPDDTYVTLPGRVSFAAENHADLFVSLHGNSDPNGTASGTETYYTRDDSKAFAEAVHPYLVAATGLKDRGVKQQSLHVTRETTMPAILLETGFLTNATDVAVIFDDDAQYRIAAAIVEGIKDYLNLS